MCSPHWVQLQGRWLQQCRRCLWGSTQEPCFPWTWHWSTAAVAYCLHSEGIESHSSYGNPWYKVAHVNTIECFTATSMTHSQIYPQLRNEATWLLHLTILLSLLFLLAFVVVVVVVGTWTFIIQKIVYSNVISTTIATLAMCVIYQLIWKAVNLWFLRVTDWYTGTWPKKH